ncbi:MAG: hypothetical protein HZA08_11690 [Nitrospirae bacterium]|nr:hypothetical protein [Nitrospirota bacterium]
MTLVGGSRNDPVYNRIADDIHQAVRQFDAVNPDLEHPNVLAFLNDPGSHCDYGDLIGVLTGQFITDNGRLLPLFTSYSEGRIREEKLRVNLYIWIEGDGRQHFFFPDINREHERNICKWFGKDPDSILSLDA